MSCGLSWRFSYLFKLRFLCYGLGSKRDEGGKKDQEGIRSGLRVGLRLNLGRSTIGSGVGS